MWYQYIHKTINNSFVIQTLDSINRVGRQHVEGAISRREAMKCTNVDVKMNTVAYQSVDSKMWTDGSAILVCWRGAWCGVRWCQLNMAALRFLRVHRLQYNTLASTMFICCMYVSLFVSLRASITNRTAKDRSSCSPHLWCPLCVSLVLLANALRNHQHAHWVPLWRSQD